ncbi:terminase family protein [Candidatus Pacearchaeota archaeon]|nr:terminase family protein [Candidatus Pacearchaeota archaeon]
MIYDPWQLEVINDTAKYILICKGRQIGATTTLAKKAAKWMAEKGKTILVGSITEEQAKLVIVMVKEMLAQHYPGMIATKKKDKPTLDKVILKNGAWIRSRAVGTMGDAFKGFTADINWFNEMSKWPELAFISIMPTLLTKGGGMWGDSTPFGKYINGTTKKTYFFKCYENLDGRWKVYYKTSPEVMKEREITDVWTKEIRDAALKFLEDQEAEMDKVQFAQEYLGQFMDEVNQWYPDAVIRSRMIAKRPEKIDPEWLVGQGNDIARMGEDAGTYEVGRLEGIRIIHMENQVSHKQPITDTAKQIIGLDEKFHGDYIFIDDEGPIGKGVYDILMDDDRVKEKVRGISNSKRIVDELGKLKGIKKTELHVKLLSMMEKGEIDLLQDEEIFQSLKSVQFYYSNDSLGTRHLKIFGNDTHIAEGLNRLTELLKYKDLNPTVYTIKV